MVHLIMRRGPENGRLYSVRGDVIQIGRGARNDIVIDDNEVSREHCRLVWNKDHFEIYDLDSSNGTYVNGQRVSESWAIAGDSIIELGDSITLELKFDTRDIGERPLRKTELLNPQITQVFLVVTVVGQPGKAIYPLDDEFITVGRAADNKVIIIEPEISRYHMRLERTKRGYEITDVGSTNGTMVNNSPLNEPRVLESGDVIRVGSTITIQYTNDPDEALLAKRPRTGDTNKLTTDSTLNRRDLKATTTTNFLNPKTVAALDGHDPDIDSLAKQILVLYARSDWERVVAPLVDRMYQSGVSAWVEQHLIADSEEWRHALEQARMECAMLVVVVSPDAMQQDHIMKIWRHFHNREKHVILLITDESIRLPIGAGRADKISYHAYAAQSAFEQVIRSIRLLQNQE